MSEKTAVQCADLPRTRQTLADDLRRLGVKPGMILLVHSSLSHIGWVCGGPVAVIQALMDVITPQGTLVMPTHTAANSEPSYWQNPPVPESWWPIIRETMPAFDPKRTPTRNMGCIPELFRTWPDVHRSNHPQVSFAAWGKYAQAVTAGHELAWSLGESSPLARIYDLAGFVLLLGVGYNRNTSFHLAEYRAQGAAEMMNGGAVLVNGRREWRTWPDLDFRDDLFELIGTAFEQTGEVVHGLVGSASCRLFPQRTAVDFAQSWLTRYYADRKAKQP
ncbi:MAG: aminoglycoside N(3)-acetyltransferase [Chloroflexi bacterium]|nr:MAG: aminoglycoside N(3)-acetyltransferase [Chloroflexota bacterium]